MSLVGGLPNGLPKWNTQTIPGSAGGQRMIIGAPCCRPYCETKNLQDDDYLTSEEWDMKRCWFNTHPQSED